LADQAEHAEALRAYELKVGESGRRAIELRQIDHERMVALAAARESKEREYRIASRLDEVAGRAEQVASALSSDETLSPLRDIINRLQTIDPNLGARPESQMWRQA
jgi:hypothetical protein